MILSVAKNMKMGNILQRAPIYERMSVPRSGQTLLSNTRVWGGPLFTAHQQLITVLSSRVGVEPCEAEYWKNYSFLNYDHTIKPGTKIVLELYSAALILNWVVGRVAREITEKASLSEAEGWSLGKESKKSLSNEIPQDLQTDILLPLRNIDFNEHLLDILPFAAEVFETSEEIINAFGPLRKSKRAAGIFYTPSDVSDYIVDRVYSSREEAFPDIESYTWLDPACGTGAFLISALYKMAHVHEISPGEEALAYIEQNLFGVDISPLALQSAAYVLIINAIYGSTTKNLSLRDSLFRIGKNFCFRDATGLGVSQRLADMFPKLSSGADFVVSNPPYIKRKSSYSSTQADLFSIVNNIMSKNLYLDFVRMITTLSHSEHGTGGMVVPLSISYNTHQEFRDLRQYMFDQKGSWWFANFDRTPDSLFGDDVKTRNSIVFFARNAEAYNSVFTSDLIRWSSRNRHVLFHKLPYSRLIAPLNGKGIPKIGDDDGQQLLYHFEKRTDKLGNFITRFNRSQHGKNDILLRNARTAYNWLPFEMASKIDVGSGEVANPKYSYWISPLESDIPIVFALIQSRFAYWLWRVWCDGFHLTDEFIMSLPLSPGSLSKSSCEKMALLGSNLWEKMRLNVVLSKNAGKDSYTYCPYNCEKIIDEIDALIVMEHGLPDRTVEYLKNILHRTIVAGRDNELATNPALRKWKLKEKDYECSVREN